MTGLFGTFLAKLHLPQSGSWEPSPLISDGELRHILEQLLQLAATHTQRLPLLQQRMLGDLASHYLGSGMDYEESRPYQPGDDLRFINWRMTARAGEFYTRLFREERKPCIFILFDRRLNMRFATRTRLKASQALRVAALFALLAQQRHIPVAGMRLDAHGQLQHEMTQLKDIMAWLLHMGQDCPAPDNAEAEPALSETLHLLQQRIHPGSRVVLISDFFDLQEKDRGVLQQLQQHNNVLAIEIRDPAEVQLPGAGWISLRSLRDGTLNRVDLSDSGLAQHYRQDMQEEQKRIEKLMQDCGIALQTISTTQEIDEILQQLGEDLR